MSIHGPELGKPTAPTEAAEPLAVKLAALWIWSVFFGLNGTLSYSFLGSGSVSNFGFVQYLNAMQPYRGNWGGPANVASEFAAMILPVANAVGMFASIAAWLFLYFYFTGYVVPVVLLGTAIPNEARRRRAAALYLARTYQLLILAALARFTPDLMTSLLPALSRLGWL